MLFGLSDNRFDNTYSLKQILNLVPSVTGSEIGSYARLQVFGFADVNNLAFLVTHDINARQCRKMRNFPAQTSDSFETFRRYSHKRFRQAVRSFFSGSASSRTGGKLKSLRFFNALSTDTIKAS